jgi:hypothetical protein
MFNSGSIEMFEVLDNGFRYSPKPLLDKKKIVMVLTRVQGGLQGQDEVNRGIE